MCTNSTEKMETPQEALPAWENSIKNKLSRENTM